MKKQIVVASVLVLFVCSNFSTPAQANPIAAPACKDIPSCGVAGIIIGTEIVGGILYYVVQNAAGAVHKVRAKQSTPPAHRSIHGAEEGEVYAGLVQSEEECKRKALVKGETDGGLWSSRVIPSGVSSPDSVWGSSKRFKCFIKREGGR